MLKNMQYLRAIYWSFKSPLSNWFVNLRMQIRHPDSTFVFPLRWLFSDVKSIQLGSQVKIGAFSEIVVEGRLPNSSISGQLVIGDRVVIGSHANIRASGGKIHISHDCLIAQHVSLIASGHTLSAHGLYRDAPWDTTKTGVFIDENVWIGAGVTVLPGCIIGRNAVVGAGSVVTKSIPANEVWAGIPAKYIRTIDRLDAAEQCPACQAIPCSSI
jgi:acetyltransferase-like isoleucine patch superfamily enzyme